MSGNDELFKAIEGARDAVAAYTGIRQQFIDSGWSAEASEQMVIEMMRAAARLAVS